MIAVRWTCLALCCLAAPNTARAADKGETKCPQHTLANQALKLTIYLPDAEKGYYRGTRFDWSGLIGQAEYKGHTFFGPWKATHDPTNAEDADGTAEEFGNAAPLGYAEAKAGEAFVKIGVGVLEKPQEKGYNFMGRYKILQAGTWKITHEKDWIEFRQDLKAPRDYAYQYVKRIALLPDGFIINHQLKNTGAKPIESEQYCHNFVILDSKPVGPEYRLTFPFEPKAKRPMDSATLLGKRLAFSRELKDGEALFSELEGSKAAEQHNEVLVEHQEAGIALKINGDAPLAHFNFFAVRRSVCPEPFIKVELAPGKEMEWTTRYAFAVK